MRHLNLVYKQLGRRPGWIMIGVLIVMGCVWGQSDDIQIYLLRETVIDTETITMEQVGIIRGDETQAGRIRPIRLGRFALSGQQILLDRQTIASRIASSGIDMNAIRISGAGTVIVRRNEQHVSTERLVQVAEVLLKGQVPAPVRISMVRAPKPLVLGKTDVQVELKPRLSGPIKGGLARVYVEAIAQGQVVGQQDLLLGVRYMRRRAVAMDDLPAGVILNEVNTKIEMIEAGDPEPANWASPFGMVTRQRVSKGQEIESERIVPMESPVVIKRRQVVVVKLETLRLSLSSLGEAQEDGKVGDYIPVKMGTDRDARVIKAKIRSDGTLEPYFEGAKS